jgi:UDP-3-O-[3-hydroxymyristoyl] glucosamine N-acyltransferase
MVTLTLADIARIVGAAAPAGATGGMIIKGVNALEAAGPDEISFIGSDRFLKVFAGTRAGAVLVQRKVSLPAGCTRAVLLVDDADLAMAKVLAAFAPPVQRPEPGVHPTAQIHPSASIGEGACIAPYVVVGRSSRIGRDCQLHSGVVIGDEVSIGDECVLHANVVVRERVQVGHRVIVNASSVLGTDGFGYRWNGSRHEKIPQIGTVIIEDDVELGSCVCVDRAKYGATRVGRGTKIDNLVQIAHNVELGEHCVLAGQTAIAGSTTIGSGVVFGGASSVRDHVHIGSGAMIAARAGVIEDVDPKTMVSGMPALPHRQQLREQAAFRRLPDLMVQARQMQEQLGELLKLRERLEAVLGKLPLEGDQIVGS